MSSLIKLFWKHSFFILEVAVESVIYFKIWIGFLHVQIWKKNAQFNLTKFCQWFKFPVCNFYYNIFIVVKFFFLYLFSMILRRLILCKMINGKKNVGFDTNEHVRNLFFYVLSLNYFLWNGVVIIIFVSCRWRTMFQWLDFGNSNSFSQVSGFQESAQIFGQYLWD